MRNMIESNKSAFGNLINNFLSVSELQVDAGRRYIKTDREEKEWLKNLKVEESQKILNDLTVVKISYDNNQYIILVGNQINKDEVDNQVLVERNINSGILTVLLSEGLVNLNKAISPLEFYNDILFQHKDGGYKGHDYNDLLPFLEGIIFFEIPLNSVLLNSNLFRITTYILSVDKSYLILNFSKTVIDFFIDISLMGSDKISFESILNSFVSSNFKHCFLELYRLVERLFPINYLKDLHDIINTKLTFLEFAASIEEVTSWRPREEDAIEKIFNQTKPETIENFNLLLASHPKLAGLSVSKCFYKIRNSIVHFRASHEDPLLSEDQWNLIIHCTLELIDEHYSKNQTLL